ncbi:unnamed protein product, partial [Symbiodinium natans]
MKENGSQGHAEQAQKAFATLLPRAGDQQPQPSPPGADASSSAVQTQACDLKDLSCTDDLQQLRKDMEAQQEREFEKMSQLLQ